VFKPSVRTRLTLWNSALLAFLLGCFAYASLSALSVVLSQRAEAAVSGSARAIAAAIVNERAAARARGEAALPDMAHEALRKILAGDLDVFIVDEASTNVLAASRRKGERAVHSTTAKPRANGPATRTASVTKGPDTLALPGRVREMLQEIQHSNTPSGEIPTVRNLMLDDGPHVAAVVRIAAGKDDDQEPAIAVAAIRSSDDDANLLISVRNTFLFAIPVALVLSIVFGYAIARASLAPVEAMAQQAARISAATLDERLPVAYAHDELGRLATVINALLERVQVAFRQQRQFVADASHELRTPIAIVRGEADVTLQRPTRDESEYRDALGVIQDESVRLTRIVDDLFLLARTDAGAPIAEHRQLDLRELAIGALRSVRTIADDHDIVLQQDIPDTQMNVEGDAPLLRRLLLNLLDNALKYTPRGGTVGLSVTTNTDNTVNIVVHDSGPGVPESLRARVFDRFVRAGPNDRAPAHNDSPRASSGAGLGLAIAAAIASAHHGSLTLEENSGGARFRTTLPLMAG
jgi:two-component system OmpR family sensor kinase